MECTYGNKLHQDIETRFKKLYDIILETSQQKGTVIIPAFSVGRTQDIIYGLRDFVADDFKIPIYVDSPMAIQATKLFEKDTEYMRPEVIDLIQAGKQPFMLKTLKFVEEAKASHMLDKAFQDNKGPLNQAKVIISASGMCEAGRILYHLNTYLEKQKTNIVFVGYQAEESLGRKIQEGQKEVTIFDKKISNLAGHYTLSGFSGHADQEELLQWLSESKPKKIILVHGEDGIPVMAEKIKALYNFETYIPKLYETIVLS
jgi:metallo-beta-lactamase family protein